MLGNMKRLAKKPPGACAQKQNNGDIFILVSFSCKNKTKNRCEAEKMRLLNIAENHTRIFVSTANLSGPMDKEARKNHALYGSIASAQANMLSSQKFTTVDDAKRALASLEKEFKK